MTCTDLDIRPMMAEDYDEVMALWQASKGVGLDCHTDTREGITAYLAKTQDSASWPAKRNGWWEPFCVATTVVGVTSTTLPSPHRIVGRALDEPSSRGVSVN